MNTVITPADLQQLTTRNGRLEWKRPARAHQKRNTMNRLESDYAAHLDVLKLAGEITEYFFEAITLKLGEDCRWTPDFLVQRPDGTLETHDTKGAKTLRRKSGAKYVKPYIEEDALVKLRTAAQQFPFRVVAVYLDGGEWREVEM